MAKGTITAEQSGDRVFLKLKYDDGNEEGAEFKYRSEEEAQDAMQSALRVAMSMSRRSAAASQMGINHQPVD